jgi:ribose transport system ATP-binding protein
MPPIVEIQEFSKTFAGRRVLDEVSLRIEPGTIHALVGQNGSGKSTLIKILAGFHAPDPGARLAVRGTDVGLPVPPGAPRRLGLAFVHQDLGLAPSLTVLENLRVGRYLTAPVWRIRWRNERREVRRLLESFGIEVLPDAPLSSLSALDRARIAILRALEDLRDHEGGLIVLDEPTAYLPRDGAERLFGTLREIVAAGRSVLFVSHRLDEVRRLADWVTVLRDGRLVASAANADLTEAELIHRILGFSLDELYPETHAARGPVVLSAERMKSDGLDDLSFEVRRGEVVGVTGLLGMGWERVLPALYGAARGSQGQLTLEGRTHDLMQMRPRKAKKLGMAFLPADRLREGGVGAGTVTENLTLPVLSKYFQRGVLRQRRELADSRAVLDEFDVRPLDPGRRFATLSGGNQQKVLLAKWFMSKPSVFLLNEPTQGVDVGTRKRIFEEIANRATLGTAFVLSSAEYADLAHLCDRVLIFRHGRVTAELSGESLTPQRVVEQCYQASNGRAAAAAR